MSFDEARYIPMIDAMLGALPETELEKVSAKRIRNSIQSLLGTDLTPFKKQFDEVLLNRYQLKLAELEELKKNPQGKAQSSNTKQGNISKKTPNIKNETDDADLAAQLHSELNKRYLRVAQEGKPGKKAKQKKASKVSKTKSKPDSERALGGFAAILCKTSEPLAKIVGKSEVTRPEAVKKIWEYIKKHNLQDPEDKRVILCDENMAVLFGPKIGTFGFNKILSKHLFKTDRKVGQDQEVVEEESDVVEDGTTTAA